MRTQDWSRVVWCAQDHHSAVHTVIQNPDVAFDQNANFFKNDRTTTVALFETQQPLTRYVVKRFNARTFGHAVKRLFRKTRARRCWQMANEFSGKGISVATPALMLEKRFGPLRFNAYYVCEYIEGAPLIEILPSLDEQEVKEVAQCIQDIFGKLKVHRLSHGDMKASNLIWHQSQVYAIDLDAAKCHSNQLSWQRAYRKDRKRFLKNWIDHPKLYHMFDERIAKQ